MAKTRAGYSGLQIALHWIVAFLVLGAFFTSDDMDDALDDRMELGLSGLEGATIHTALGGAAFAFVLARLIIRLTRGAPEPHGSPLVQLAATSGHRLLYALMVAAPLLGAITWYGQVEVLGDLHALVGQALIIVAVGHLLMAMLHQALWADGTLMRMFSPSRE